MEYLGSIRDSSPWSVCTFSGFIELSDSIGLTRYSLSAAFRDIASAFSSDDYRFAGL